MKNYKDFKADLLSNEALRLELENALKAANLEKLEEKEAFSIEFGKTHGYEFTEEDVSFDKAASKVLDEKELSLVSGGKVKSNCDFDYACSFAFNSCAFCNECYNNHSCLENAGDYCFQIFLTPDMK